MLGYATDFMLMVIENVALDSLFMKNKLKPSRHVKKSILHYKQIRQMHRSDPLVRYSIHSKEAY